MLVFGIVNEHQLLATSGKFGTFPLQRKQGHLYSGTGVITTITCTPVASIRHKRPQHAGRSNNSLHGPPEVSLQPGYSTFSTSSRTPIGRDLLELPAGRQSFGSGADSVGVRARSHLFLRALGTVRGSPAALHLQRLFRCVSRDVVLPRVHFAGPGVRADVPLAVVGRYHARAVSGVAVQLGSRPLLCRGGRRRDDGYVFRGAADDFSFRVVRRGKIQAEGRTSTENLEASPPHLHRL